MAAFVGLAFEVTQQSAGAQGLGAGEFVVPAEQVEVGVGTTHGAEDDQVEPVEGMAGEGGPVEAPFYA